MHVHRRASRLAKIAVGCGALGAFSCAPLSRAHEPAEQPLLINPGGLTFATLPGIPSCATTATLRGDPAEGPAVFLMKLTNGCKIPWHWHTPNEQVTVVTGTFQMEMKDAATPLLRPGAYVFMPGHHVHQGSCPTACTLFSTMEGIFDVHYVDDSGTEISFDEAMKAVKPPAKKAKKAEKK